MIQRRLWQRWRHVFDLYVANSAAVERRLTEHGIGPTIVIWNGVPRRPPRPPLADPPVVGFVGRLSREKGVHVLLRAFAEARLSVPAARLLVVGDGPERGRLMAFARELGVGGAVRWTGHLDHEAMERALEAAWVQAVPSILEEPFGLVAAEAMMRGTAVAAAGHGGLSEIVRDGETGVLTTPGDPTALASALASLLGDRARCETMGQAGRAWARERLSLEACAERFLGVYGRIREEDAA
jgi:glycosyltransferase involved in cell wall biosynthesis